MKIINPFGPRIGIFKLPKKLVNKINIEVEKIILNKNLNKKLDYSKKLVGEVKQEFQLPKKIIKHYLSKYIEKHIRLFLKNSINKSVKKIKIKKLWIVRQFKNEYNPIHYHDGHLSAVGYLKIPKNLNKGIKKNKISGTIDFVSGSKKFLCESIYNHTPKAGDIIIFPNYLMHTAYPFNVDGERRSFSLNIEIDKEIANVFHD